MGKKITPGFVVGGVVVVPGVVVVVVPGVVVVVVVPGVVVVVVPGVVVVVVVPGVVVVVVVPGVVVVVVPGVVVVVVTGGSTAVALIDRSWLPTLQFGASEQRKPTTRMWYGDPLRAEAELPRPQSVWAAT